MDAAGEVAQEQAEEEQRPERKPNWNPAGVQVPAERQARFWNSIIWLVGYAGSQLQEAVAWKIDGKGGDRFEAEDLPRFKAVEDIYDEFVDERDSGETWYIPGPFYTLHELIGDCIFEATAELRDLVGDEDPLGDGDALNARELVTEVVYWQGVRDALGEPPWIAVDAEQAEAVEATC